MIKECEVIGAFDPLAPAVLANPYPYYRWLQNHDPIHWGGADDAGLPGRWYLVRYVDVVAVRKDLRSPKRRPARPLLACWIVSPTLP